MRQLLIAHSSEELAASLSTMLSSQFQVTVCSDGNTAQNLLATLRPEALILDLLLPGKDGITILEDAGPFKPDVILATTRNMSPYVRISASLHDIDYIMQVPCAVRNIALRLMEAVELKHLDPPRIREPESQTTRYLQMLSVPSQMDGYIQLQVGIPLFARDRAQKLSKELYPEVAKLCGFHSGEQVERSIRCAVKAAWVQRSDEIWQRFFQPDKNGSIPCPSNKVFISRLAEKLVLDAAGRHETL